MDDDIEIIEEPVPSSSKVPVDPVGQPSSSTSKTPQTTGQRSIPENLRVSNRPAKRRWGMLSIAVGKKSETLDAGPSFKDSEFNSFGLYSLEQVEDEKDEKGRWMRLCWKTDESLPKVLVRLLTTTNVPLDVLTGFNNTGNVRIWPSEECLAWLLLSKYRFAIKDKKLLELGCGMTALAAITASFFADFVVASDGSQTSVDNAAAIIEKNERLNCKAVFHRWGEESTISEMAPKSFDVIVAGDCFFEQTCHEALISSIDKYLKPDGLVLMASPERNGAMRSFIDKICAKNGFTVEESDDFCPAVTAKIAKLTNLNDDSFKVDKHHIKLLTTIEEHLAETASNVLAKLKEEMKTEGLHDFEFPDDVLMRVAGVAQAVLIHKWGKQLENIAKHCKHTTVTEEDVDLLFAHNSVFSAEVEKLADSYDDPVDEFAVADKKTKSTKRSGSADTAKSPMAGRDTMNEEEDDMFNDEEDGGDVTSPEPRVKTVIGPKNVVRVPSFSNVGAASVKTTPKSGQITPFSAKQQPFKQSGEAAPVRQITPLITRSIPSTTTTPIVKNVRPSTSLASHVPQIPIQRNSAIRPMASSRPTPSGSTSHQHTPLKTSLQTSTIRNIRPQQPSVRHPIGQIQQPTRNNFPSTSFIQRQPAPRLPSTPVAQRTHSQQSHDSWNDDSIFDNLSNLALITPQAKKQDDAYDSFEDDDIFQNVATNAPTTSIAPQKRPSNSDSIPEAKRQKSTVQTIQEFSFSDDDF